MQRREDGTHNSGAAEFWRKVGAEPDKPVPPSDKEIPPQSSQPFESTAAASTAEPIDAARLGPIPEQLSWGESLIDFFSRFGSALPAIVGIVIIFILAAGAWYSYKQRSYDTAALVQARAKPAAAPLPVEEPAPEDDANAEAEIETSVDPQVVFPCPSGLPFCIGGAGKLKDAVCPADKPIWAHYLDNDGLWKRAGCYAAEADARSGLSVLLGSNTPTLAAQDAPQSGPKTESSPRLDSAAKQKHTPRVEDTEPKHIDSKSGSLAEFTVSFELAFGIVVESRTYPTLQMKRKALDLWKRERKILEPDGTINEKYVLRPQSPGPIPGH